MTCSLMSIFDPHVILLQQELSLKWLVFLFTFLMVSGQYWASPSSLYLLVEGVWKGLLKSFSTSFSSFKEVSVLLVALFWLILSLNWLGMVPYSFAVSSHLLWNLSLSLPLWLGGLIYMFSKSLMDSIAHFVPLGAPSVLIPFLVIVETVSLFIRPFALAVRLMANIMSGHMVMVLLENLILSLEEMGLMLYLLKILISVFEIAVSAIQAYVFMNLMSLYWAENAH